MGARRKIIGFAILMTVLAAGTSWAQNQAGPDVAANMEIEGQGQRIEQVYLNLPQVIVYGTGFTEQDVESGEGYLSQQKLELVNTSRFSQRGEGICYYVLLDISGSIPKTYFQAVKEGILALQDSLGEQDRLVLCTFGETVTLVADGGQTPEELAFALGNLTNRDQKTLLFEGIDRVALLSDQQRLAGGGRSVLAVISDGEDIAVGKKLAQEAQNTLREKGIPAYAFCIKDTATSNINNFGEFARTSGGNLVTFTPEEGVRMLLDLADSLSDDICAEYRADSNVVTNKEEWFHLKFADGSVLSKAVMNVHWIPDLESPRLLSATAVGDRQIRLSFSEPVTGLEGAANYQVLVNGEAAAVTGVAFDKADNTVVSLSMEKPVINGTYEITCANITDCSMEKNPLEGSLTVVIEDATEQEVPVQSVQTESSDYTGELFLLFAALVALAVILLVKGRKKAKQETEEPISEKRHIEAVILVSGMPPASAVWELGTSLTVGRSSVCDVFFDDPELSRQHFSLETEDGNLYIRDLKSMNGTFVNKVRVQNKRRLESGDMIEAGSVKITVRW